MNYYSIKRTTYYGCGDHDETEEIGFFTTATLREIKDHVVIELFVLSDGTISYSQSLFQIIKEYIKENKLMAIEITNGYGEVFTPEISEEILYDNSSFAPKDQPLNLKTLLTEEERIELEGRWRKDKEEKEEAAHARNIINEKARRKREKKKKLEEEYKTFLELQKKFKNKLV